MGASTSRPTPRELVRENLVTLEEYVSLSRRQSLRGSAGAATIAPAALAARHDSMTAIRLVILDVGGTIIEDRGDIPGLLKSALEHHGVGSTPEEIAKLRGASKREIVRYFVDKQTRAGNIDRDVLTNSIYDEFTAKLIEVYRSVPPIAGAEDAIRQLRERGLLVATTTGFDRAITASIFRRLGGRNTSRRRFAATM